LLKNSIVKVKFYSENNSLIIIIDTIKNDKDKEHSCLLRLQILFPKAFLIKTMLTVTAPIKAA